MHDACRGGPNAVQDGNKWMNHLARMQQQKPMNQLEIREQLELLLARFGTERMVQNSVLIYHDGLWGRTMLEGASAAVP